MEKDMKRIRKNFRLDSESVRQVTALAAAWSTTETAVVARSVERAYQQERQNMYPEYNPNLVNVNYYILKGRLLAAGYVAIPDDGYERFERPDSDPLTIYPRDFGLMRSPWMIQPYAPKYNLPADIASL